MADIGSWIFLAVVLGIPVIGHFRQVKVYESFIEGAKDGKGRVPACEVMISTTAIRNLIREDRIFQITSVIQSGGVEGMQTLDQDLQRLVTQGKIERKIAMEIADNPKLFKQNVL